MRSSLFFVLLSYHWFSYLEWMYMYTFSTCFSLNYRKFNHWQKRNWTLIVWHVKQLYENVAEEKELISRCPCFPRFQPCFRHKWKRVSICTANFTRCRGIIIESNFHLILWPWPPCRIVDQFADNGRLTVSELKLLG